MPTLPEPPPPRQCPNCDGPFGDGPVPRFCPHCSQATALQLPTLRERLREFVDRDIVRPAKTLGLLLAVPGRLTVDYIAGRRLRYILPRQLFLGAAFLFFFAAKLLPALQIADGPEGKAGGPQLHVGAAKPAAPVITISRDAGRKARAKALAEAASAVGEAASDVESAEVAAQIASAAERIARTAGTAPGAAPASAANDEDKDDDAGRGLKYDEKDGDGPWTWGDGGCDVRPVRRGASAPAAAGSAARPSSAAAAASGARDRSTDCNWLERRAKVALQHWEDDPRRAREEYTAKALSTAPYAVFLMLPLFAALVMLHYIVRHRRFNDHLVFGMHLHAFWFIVALLVAVAPAALPAWPLLVYLPIYGLIAMRRVYGGGWFSTFVRACSISLVYLILMSFAAGLLAVAVALL